jgi:tricorn protease-like protein
MKPDLGLIVAVQRMQTGAEIHKLNNLLHQYVCACHTENHKLADRAKHELIAVVIEKERVLAIK